MRYRKLSPTGDFVFGNGSLDFYRDNPEAVAQSVQTRLLLFLGEWFLNIDEGTPYMLEIIGKKSQAQADAAIQNRILTTDGVVNIETYQSSIDQDTRHMTVSATINTVYGPTAIQVSNYVNF